LRIAHFVYSHYLLLYFKHLTKMVGSAIAHIDELAVILPKYLTK